MPNIRDASHIVEYVEYEAIGFPINRCTKAPSAEIQRQAYQESLYSKIEQLLADPIAFRLSSTSVAFLYSLKNLTHDSVKQILLACQQMNSIADNNEVVKAFTGNFCRIKIDNLKGQTGTLYLQQREGQKELEKCDIDIYFEGSAISNDSATFTETGLLINCIEPSLLQTMKLLHEQGYQAFIQDNIVILRKTILIALLKEELEHIGVRAMEIKNH
jgi:hypothetical protein